VVWNLSRLSRNETDAMRPRWCNPIVGDSSAGDLPSGPVELIGGVEKRDNGVESGDNKVIPPHPLRGPRNSQ